MSIKLTPEEFSLLQAFIEEISGIRVGDGKAYLIESRLSGLLKENNCRSFGDFYLKARTGPQTELRSRIVDAMSTQETLWFRDAHPYRILEQKILPDLAQQDRNGGRRSIRVWSAASSTGQEPYSLAMIFLDAMGIHSTYRNMTFEILATDIAPSALKVATSGMYDRIAMGRGLPPKYRQRHFSEEGRYSRLSDEVKKLVKFRQFNLKDSFSSLGMFDIVLCRNVAIYFADDFKRELYAKIKRALHPPGYLFLGSSESISAYSSEYELLDHDGAIYYKVKGT